MRVDGTYDFGIDDDDSLRWEFAPLVVLEKEDIQVLHGFTFNNIHTFKLPIECGYFRFTREGFRLQGER